MDALSSILILRADAALVCWIRSSSLNRWNRVESRRKTNLSPERIGKSGQKILFPPVKIRPSGNNGDRPERKGDLLQALEALAFLSLIAPPS